MWWDARTLHLSTSDNFNAWHCVQQQPPIQLFSGGWALKNCEAGSSAWKHLETKVDLQAPSEYDWHPGGLLLHSLAVHTSSFVLPR